MLADFVKTRDGKSIGEVPQKKDPYWWMHPAYRGHEVLDMDTLNAMPQGGYTWKRHDAAAQGADGDGAQHRDGHFAQFAQLLYKANGSRHGPVKSWYVIVCVEPGRLWAVGQLRADPVTPVQVFEDLVFDSEDAARARAEELRDG
jgi:hypothetical protein